MEHLHDRLSKRQVMALSRELHHDEAGIRTFCRLMLSAEDARVASNAAWILYHLPTADKRIYLFPFYDEIATLGMAPELKMRRGLVLSILLDLVTDSNFRTDLFDFCLAHIADKREADSSRSMMINLAAKMCRLVPELANELKVCLDMLEYEMAPSIAAARRNAMKVVESLMKETESSRGNSSLRQIPNVGSQTEQDLIAMGYTSVESLKGKKAEDLYEEECRLRGCMIDRCQLYLYRALEYFVHTENPDREKCRWWYWEDDYFYPSPCGARCVDCSSFPKVCKGCRKIKGKVHWLQYTGDTVCPIWKCCKEKKRENCGGCPDLPCSRFMKDPSISDEENEANLKKMMDNLATYKKHT
ncbi:helix-hairpin-helix domain-containing protein [Bacteroides mediterraneensis]|uniref:helix-hairpin-helix domain-containing protein n=1 Tax=Bacteroides mediterraneensis TaxID=1841856 RepID=UPI001EF70CDF|nr:helix-hairpin-helix domain-containing protein [Bacteroides mediterraneensis]